MREIPRRTSAEVSQKFQEKLLESYLGRPKEEKSLTKLWEILLESPEGITQETHGAISGIKTLEELPEGHSAEIP